MKNRWMFNGINYANWAEMRMAQLNAKDKRLWDENDYEAYHYIQQLRFEASYEDDDYE